MHRLLKQVELLSDRSTPSENHLERTISLFLSAPKSPNKGLYSQEITGISRPRAMEPPDAAPLLSALLRRATGVTWPDMPKKRESNARERILSAAYELFSQRGIRGVGVDELISRSGVANATFYRHFPSKDDLVRAFLERREELWTIGTIVQEAASRQDTPKGQLLAIFDIFDEWFQRPDFEGDPFITILLEMGPSHPLGQAALEHLDTVRDIVQRLAVQAGLRNPDSFAHSWHILMKGAIITARMGDLLAAQRAREMGRSLIHQFEPPAPHRDHMPVRQNADARR